MTDALLPTAPDQITISLRCTEAGQPVAVTLDSTPVLTWLAAVRCKEEHTDETLRRGVIARLVWQAAGQRSPGLIDNVAYVLGRRVWGDQPRRTLAGDLLCLRRALAAAGQRLRYDNRPGRKGLYVQGRPALDPQMVKAIRGAIAEVDPAQMAIMRQHTPAWRVAQAASMIEAVESVGAYRLRLRQPQLDPGEALRLLRRKRTYER
jgi:hypothetical protein